MTPNTKAALVTLCVCVCVWGGGGGGEREINSINREYITYTETLSSSY